MSSVLNGSYQRFELLVVDQSPDDTTRDALARFGADPRVRYLADLRPGSGAASARNLGVTHSSGELLALLDDDVEARPDWLARIAEEFSVDGALEFVCGKLGAPALDPLPQHLAFFSARPRVARWELPLTASGANFSMRRALFERVGGYAELRGLGERARAADDADLCYRIVRSGAKWRACAWIEVVHTHLDHARASDPELDWRRNYGLGENLGRWMRRGDLLALGLLGVYVARSLVLGLLALGAGAPAHELRHAPALLYGFLSGFVLPPRRGLRLVRTLKA